MERPARWKWLLKALAGVALLAYPLLVWRGLEQGSPRRVALVLLCVVAPAAFVRMRKSRRQDVRGMAFLPLLTVACLSLASLLNSQGLILFVPVVLNAVLFVGFGATLRAGSVPMIERFARLQEEHLSDAQREWCLLWTRIWIAFFAVNGATALLLGLFAPLSWWAFYTGLLSYGLCGILFASEWVLRRRRFHLSTDPGTDDLQ